MRIAPWPVILAFKLWKIKGQSPSRFRDIATLNAAWPVGDVS